MPKLALVSNTSPLLYLGRIQQLHLLPALFDPVFVPELVVLELDAGRLLRADTIDPRALDWLKPAAVPQSTLDRLPPNRLGPGEQAAIAHALTKPGSVVGLDDRQARQLAQQLGLTIVGTVGILVKAKQAGLITTVRSLLDAVQKQGFRMSADLYAEALRLVGEQHPLRFEHTPCPLTSFQPPRTRTRLPAPLRPAPVQSPRRNANHFAALDPSALLRACIERNILERPEDFVRRWLAQRAGEIAGRRSRGLP